MIFSNCQGNEFLFKPIFSIVILCNISFNLKFFIDPNFHFFATFIGLFHTVKTSLLMHSPFVNLAMQLITLIFIGHSNEPRKLYGFVKISSSSHQQIKISSTWLVCSSLIVFLELNVSKLHHWIFSLPSVFKLSNLCGLFEETNFSLISFSKVVIHCPFIEINLPIAMLELVQEIVTASMLQIATFLSSYKYEHVIWIWILNF